MDIITAILILFSKLIIMEIEAQSDDKNANLLGNLIA